jgi:hypothetical protein
MSGIDPLHRASRAGLRRPHSVVTEIIERDRIADRLKGVTSVGHPALTRHSPGTAPHRNPLSSCRALVVPGGLTPL